MKRAWKWLISLVVILAVVVAVDRVAVMLVERQAVSFVEEKRDVADATLDIQGFPFLAQVARGELDHVSGTASSATFGGLTVTDVRLDVHDVGTSSPYPVRSGVVSGAVSVATLQELVRAQTGLSLDVVSDGDSLSMIGEVAGLELAVDVVPTVADPVTLGITVESVRIGGASVALDVLPAFAQEALSDVAVGLNLPTGITLDSVEVVGDAVRVTVVGTDVSLKDLLAS